MGLSAVELRQANEEVAISFILSLRVGHAPNPHRHYNVPPPDYNSIRAGPARIPRTDA